MLINIAQAGPMASAPPLSTLVMNVLSFVLTIVGAIAVLVIVVAGVMYMTAGGDAERVARAKRALIGGIIGICVVILSLTIVKTIIGLV